MVKSSRFVVGGPIGLQDAYFLAQILRIGVLMRPAFKFASNGAIVELIVRIEDTGSSPESWMLLTAQPIGEVRLILATGRRASAAHWPHPPSRHSLSVTT